MLTAFTLVALGLHACKPNVHERTGQKKYFDLKSFINADSAKLTRNKASVDKTVSYNDAAPQRRRVQITNWGNELSAFAVSDLNKPAWRDSYTIQRNGDSVTYIAIDPKLTTRRMVITGADVSSISKISIFNFSENLLYSASEHLTYYPDSLYIIDKLQQVKLLGKKHYFIKGVIEKK